MAGLLDYIQAASNAVAGNVSGPVDLINAGLLGMGLPMPQNPVGGSRWMAEKGLTREVSDPYARVVGETAGLLAPTVIAARAPQIANGLLNHADAYRRYHAATTAPGAPATVWHGSPHKFDKFDSAHIGKGEGAQAYGHGLYFAENKDVANSYAGMRPMAGSFTRNGKPWEAQTYSEMLAESRLRGAGSYDKAISSVTKQMESAVASRNLEESQRLSDMLNAIKAMKKSGVEINAGGALYKVDLPDDAIARMLDWDKPLSQQPEAVRKALERSGLGKDAALTGKDIYRKVAEFDAQTNVAQKVLAAGGDAPSRLKMVFPGITDAQIAQAISRAQRPPGDAVASSVLRDTGLTGIRYLDGGSRGAGTGTSNYVVFPGEEGLLKILGRE